MPDIMTMVDRGIDYLDAKYPEWLETIDLVALNMVDMRYCILGQLAEKHGQSYEEMLGQAYETLGHLDSGFDIDSTADYLWQELQTCWVQRIRERQLENQ